MSTLDGDLLTPLDSTQRSAYLAPRGAPPRAGSIVHLWRLPGIWAVWSTGPTSGTWWVKAEDDVASQLVVQLEAKPSRGEPVVQQVWRQCIAVRSRDIRPAGRR